MTGKTTVSAANFTDDQGNPLSNVLLYFQPCTSPGGQAIAYRGGGPSGGQRSSEPVIALCTGGAFSLVLDDVSMTQPVNIGYLVTALDGGGKNLLGPGYLIQPSGATWSFDAFIPNLAGQVTVQNGPQGPQGPQGIQGVGGVAGTTTLAGTTGSFAVPNKLSAAFIGGAYGAVMMFGDSITRGAGVASEQPGQNPPAWAYKLMRDFGGNGQNFGVGGDQAADMSLRVQQNLSPTVSRNPAVTMMISTNDVNVYSSDPNGQDVFIRALKHSIAWATIPDIAKATFAGAACVLSGGWTLDAGSPGFAYTQSVGATATLTVTCSSSVLYLGYVVRDTSAGTTASVTIDGVAQAPLSFAASRAVATANGLNGSNFLARYAVSPGVHTVVVTATAVNTGGYVQVGWVGSPYPIAQGTQAPPIAFVGGCPWNQGNSPADITAAYDTQIKTVVSSMADDGLNVFFVDIRQGTNTANAQTATPLNATTDYTGGTEANGYVDVAGNAGVYHPGTGGHRHLYECFRAAIQPVFCASKVQDLWAGTSGAITSTRSSSGLGGAPFPPQTFLDISNLTGYAGLTITRGSTATNYGLTIYDDGNIQFDASSGGRAFIFSGHLASTTFLATFRSVLGGPNLITFSTTGGATFSDKILGVLQGNAFLTPPLPATTPHLFSDGNINIDGSSSGQAVIVHGNLAGLLAVFRAALGGPNKVSIDTSGNITAASVIVPDSVDGHTYKLVSTNGALSLVLVS